MAEITLSCGKVATMRPGTGRDLKLAMRMVPKDQDGNREEILISYALLAILTTFDGANVTLEDIEDMPLDDLSTLLERLGGSKGKS